MEKFNLPSIIALITIFISFLLSFFLLTVKTKNKLANVLLSAFILVCAADISGIIIGQNLKNQPELYEFIKSFTFIIFPLFYYYVLSICYINFKLKIKSLFHILPFIFYNLLILTTLLFAKSELLSFTLHKLLWIFSTIILKLQALLYLIAIIYVLKKYKKVYLENYANGSIEIYKWLYSIVLIFLFTLPLTIIKDFLSIGNHQEMFTWFIIVLTIIALIMLCWFILRAMYNSEIFRGINLEIKPTVKLPNRKIENKSHDTELDTKYATLIEQLRKYMTEKEPFLEPTLTLQDLALQMHIPSRKLSILINQHIGQHFFEFINKYRIEKAIEILEKSSNNEFTIQQILFEVGFNSKSSFNTAFKKQTQLTPTKYKNQLFKNKP